MQLRLELLEQRDVPSAATFFPDGTLRIVGIDGPDVIDVRQGANRISVQGIGISTAGGTVSSVAADSVKVIDILPMQGRDRIYLNRGSQTVAKTVNLLGAIGDDVLYSRSTPTGLGIQTRIRKLAVCPDGTVVTLAGDGRLAATTGPGNSWRELDSSSTMFSIDGAGAVYDLTTIGTLWRSSNVKSNGQSFRNDVITFAVTPSGEAYTLARGGSFQHWHPAGDVWEELDSSTTSFAVDHRGVVYDLTANGALLEQDSPGNPWQELDSNSLSFAIDSNGAVYDFTRGGSLWRRPNVGSPWQNLDSNTRSFALDVSDVVYDLTGAGRLLRWTGPGSSWKELDSRTLAFAVDLNGVVYDQTRGGFLWRWPGPGNTWQRLDSATSSFDLDSNGTVLLQSTGHGLYRWFGSGFGWQKLDRNTEAFAVEPNGTMYLQTTGNRLLRWAGKGTPWETLDDAVVSFKVDPVGFVYAQHADGELLRKAGTGDWETLDSTTANFTLDANGTLFLRNNGNHLWRWAGKGATWVDLDGNTSSFAVDRAGVVYAQNPNNKLWRWAGAGAAWELLDSNTRSFALDRLGTVYLLTTGDSLLNWAGRGAPWQKGAIAVDAFCIGADDEPVIVSRLRSGSMQNLERAGRRAVFYDPANWVPNGFNYEDVVQGKANNCTIAAALAAAAFNGYDLGSRISYLGGNWYNVYLYEFGWVRTYFDGRIDRTDLQPDVDIVPLCDAAGNTRQIVVVQDYWPLLFNRAYTREQARVNWYQEQSDDSGWFRPFNFDWPAVPWHSPKNAGFAIAGGDKNNWDTTETSLFGHLSDNLALHSICLVTTTDKRYGGAPIPAVQWFERSAGHNHVWAILGIRQDADGNSFVSLYNPWGEYRELSWFDFVDGFDQVVMVTTEGVHY